MSFEGDDFGFVGGAYEAPMLLQDAQRLINWFCEIDPTGKGKEAISLLGSPGLNPLLTLNSGQGLNCRGGWVLPGRQQALVAIGNVMNLITITVPATQTAIAQFSQATVGFLLTNSGPVVMRDNGVLTNGAGGYVLIVDGTYAYYYRISGLGTFTFTGGVASGSTTISLPGTLPVGLLISPLAVLSDSGNIPANTTIASIDYNTPAITMSAAATGTNASETITLTVQAFGRITDPGFVGADRVIFIEGWLGINQPGTRTFQTTGPVPYTLMFPPSFFALKDATTDNLNTMYEQNREWWLIGDKASEVWYNSGGATFAFSRLPGIGPRIGCAAKHSIAQVGPELCWLGRIGEQGENVIVMTNQYSFRRVSTHAIEHAISTYPVVSDAIGDSYEEEGHIFYQITFPTADVTWVLDMTTYEASEGKLGWFQRLSWDPNAGVYHRHRANFLMNFADIRMAGDYQSAQLHQQSRQVYTDAGAPLRCQRRTPHLWSRRNRKRIFYSSLQIEFTPGVGLQVGQGSDPQVMIRWSDDGGQSWGNEVWAPIGKVGDFMNRAMIFQLGYARDRVWEANFSDPVPRDIIGATLFGEAEEAA